MSFYEIASLLVWVVSSVAVVYSIYQVNRQTRIFARQTEYVARSLVESSLESLNNQSREITRIFVAHPELRPYFYYSQPIEEGDPNFHRAETVAELILDIFWTMTSQAARTELGPEMDVQAANQMWNAFVSDSFGLSPIMVRTLTKRKDWYGQAMVDQMNAILQRRQGKAAG